MKTMCFNTMKFALAVAMGAVALAGTGCGNQPGGPPPVTNSAYGAMPSTNDAITNNPAMGMTNEPAATNSVPAPDK